MPDAKLNPRADIGQAALSDRGGQVYNVKSYGAVGNGIADDTAAIQAAIAAAASNAVIYFPCGKYLVTSTLTLDKLLTFRGTRSNATSQGAFGTGAYGSGVGEDGSTILTAMTSGNLIEHLTTANGTADPYLSLNVEHLHLKGLGDNTRTTQGLVIGTPSRPGYVHFTGLRVSNFAVGVVLTFVENSTIDAIWIYGCDVGMKLLDATNANTFTNFNAQSCGDGAIVAGTKNIFVGGAIQDCARTGMTVYGEENAIRDIYFENRNAAFGIDLKLPGSGFTTGAHYTVIDGCHLGGSNVVGETITGDHLRVATTACRISGTKYVVSLEIQGTAQETVILGHWGGTLTDNGVGTVYLAGSSRFAGSLACGVAAATAQVHVQAQDTTTPTTTLQRFAGSTADLLHGLHEDGSTVLGKIASDFSITASALTVSGSVHFSAIGSGSVLFAGTGGIASADPNLTWNGTTRLFHLGFIDGAIVKVDGGTNDLGGFTTDAGGFARVGMMKYSGMYPVLVAGSASPLQIGHRTDSNDVSTQIGTFRPELTFDTSGKASFAFAAGFNGATPPAQAASPGTATGTDAAVVNAVVTILRNLGFCS